MKGILFLNKAKRIFINRRNTYGNPTNHWHEVAERWSLTLGTHIQPHDVVICMIELKLTRIKQNPKHFDSIIDIAGYAAVLAELMQVHGGDSDEKK